jgi:hypothetical protein
VLSGAFTRSLPLRSLGAQPLFLEFRHLDCRFRFSKLRSYIEEAGSVGCVLFAMRSEG